MKIRVPTAHQEPLRQLAAMPADTRRRLVDSVRSAPALLDQDELVDRIRKSTSLDERASVSIVWMLVSMYRASEGDREGFVEQVADAARGLLLGGERPDVDWAAFASDLAALLTCDESLGATAKVVGLRREYGNVYCSARVLTDIRPVFGTDPARPPLAGAVVHTLRITYHAGDEHKDFYVALDSADLRGLGDVLERALTKESSLRTEINKTAMKYLAKEPG